MRRGSRGRVAALFIGTGDLWEARVGTEAGAAADSPSILDRRLGAALMGGAHPSAGGGGSRGARALLGCYAA